MNVISSIVYFIYLYYLLMVFFVRHRQQLMIGHKRITNHFGVATTFTVLLLIWGGLSLLWTPSPFLTALYYLSYLVKVFFAYLLCKLCPIRDVLRSVCKGTAYAAAASVPVAIIITGYSSGRLLENVSSGGVGTISINICIGFLSVIYLILDCSISKISTILLMMFYVSGLYFSFARTRIIALVVAIIIYGLFAPAIARRRFARLVLIAVGIMAAWIILSPKVNDYMYHSGPSGIDTLSGRTILWAQTLNKIRSGPSIRGFGLFAFYHIGPNPFTTLRHLAHAHNEFLNLWFNLGLVGVALASGLYLALIYTSLKAIMRGIGSLAILTLCVVVFCLVDGITDASSLMCVLPSQWLLLFDCLVSTALAGAVRATTGNIII